MTITTNHEDDELEEWEKLLLKKLKAIYRKKQPPIQCCKNNKCNCEALLLGNFCDIIETSMKDQK